MFHGTSRKFEFFNQIILYSRMQHESAVFIFEWLHWKKFQVNSDQLLNSLFKLPCFPSWNTGRIWYCIKSHSAHSHVWYNTRLYHFVSVFFECLAYFLGINDNWIQAFKGNVSSFAVDACQSDIKYFWQGFLYKANCNQWARLRPNWGSCCWVWERFSSAWPGAFAQSALLFCFLCSPPSSPSLPVFGLVFIPYSGLLVVC